MKMTVLIKLDALFLGSYIKSTLKNHARAYFLSRSYFQGTAVKIFEKVTYSTILRI